MQPQPGSERREIMMPMFLTVFLGGGEQPVAEVPVTPETVCRDVVEVCKEAGEAECYLAEAWGGAERVVGEDEPMLELVRRWGKQRGEVHYLLRHQRPPGQETGGGASDQTGRKQNKTLDRHLDSLVDLASLQQQQIEAQRQLLASKQQCVLSLQQRDSCERERVQRLKENVQKQETRLRRLRALQSHVEHKRNRNSRLVEEIEQMNSLFQQKQQELLVAVARVEELSDQLEALRSSRPPPLRRSSSSAELELLHSELQLRNKLNQDQSVRLQQHQDGLSRTTRRVEATERRLLELRQRLWKKKAALQQDHLLVASEGGACPRGGASRVAAVGPYMPSPQAPPVPPRQEVPVKPSYPDGTATLPPPDSAPKPRPQHGQPITSSQAPDRISCVHAATLPRASRAADQDKPLRPDAPPLGPEAPPPVPSRTNHGTEKQVKMAAPLLPGQPRPPGPPYGMGTFPGKRCGVAGQLLSSHTLPLPGKHDAPPAAAVRPFTPEAPPPPLQKPQTLAASSIYCVYTQHAGGGGGTLPRCHARVYGKPLPPSSGGQQRADAAPTSGSRVDDGGETEGCCRGNSEGAEPSEHAPPRPLSPTKLLPFLSNPLWNPSDADLEALRRRLQRAPRPLKKRSSITEPEGPGGPHIQKLLYQKTTLAAMETIPAEAPPPAGEEDWQTPPPVPPRLPVPSPAPCQDPPPPPEEAGLTAPRPPYPPPPYPASSGAEPGGHASDKEPPEVAGKVDVPQPRRSILRSGASERSGGGRRVKFSPLALLLDSSLEGEFDLVQRVVYEVDDPSAANDEGITALHNAVCAGHADIVKFLVQFGVNVNAADSDGWTPLHCAASCNNVQMCKFLVESGAAVFAATLSDQQTAADKCEELEDGFAQCSQFLHGVQDRMGAMNGGLAFGLWGFEPRSADELGFREGDGLTVLRRDDGAEAEWWWARRGEREGLVPRNLLGLSPRIRPQQRSLA